MYLNVATEKSVAAAGKRPWRFSVRTLLFIVVVIAMAITLALQSMQLGRARRELRQLRNEVGYLSVDNPNQVHVIAVDMNEPETWRWRMFLPKGVRYSWCLGYGDIPAKGVPKPRIRHTSNEPYSDEGVEVVVTAKLRQMDNGDWSLSVSSTIGDRPDQMGGARVTIPAEEIERFRERSVYELQIEGDGGTETVDAKGPIVLLMRRIRPDGTNQPLGSAMPGYMIWLERTN